VGRGTGAVAAVRGGRRIDSARAFPFGWALLAGVRAQPVVWIARPLENGFPDDAGKVRSSGAAVRAVYFVRAGDVPARGDHSL